MTDTITQEARRVDLPTLVTRLEELQARKADAVVSAERIRSEGGVLYVRGMGAERMRYGLDSDTEGAFAPSDLMVGQVADRLRIPAQYLRRLAAERADLFDANVNGWLHGTGPTVPDDPENPGRVLYVAGSGPDPRKFLVRTYMDGDAPGVGRALLSDAYKPMDYLDALTAALLGIKDSGQAVEVVQADLSPTRMYVRFAAPGLMAQMPNLLRGYRSPVTPRFNPDPGRPQVGDVFAGFEISDSEVGWGALQLMPKFTVLACTNGMTIPLLGTQQLAVRLIHSGSRLAEGPLAWSADTRQKVADLVQAQVRDAVTQFLDPAFMAEVAATIEAKAGRELEHPADVIEAVGNALAFSDETRAGVLDHFIRAGQVTSGGVANAVTSFASTVSDADLANELEALAIQAMELAFADAAPVAARVRAPARAAAVTA